MLPTTTADTLFKRLNAVQLGSCGSAHVYRVALQVLFGELAKLIGNGRR
jgi:hypothetical protein